MFLCLLQVDLNQYIIDNFSTCVMASRNCFLAYFTHKFRSTIGKSKQIHPGDCVLVGLSGGASSTALLHLISEGLQENSHKKLRFNPVFLFIDGTFMFYCFTRMYMHKYSEASVEYYANLS